MKRTWKVVIALTILLSVIMNGASVSNAATSTIENGANDSTSLDLSQLEDFLSDDEIEKMKETIESEEMQEEAKKGMALQPYVDASGTYIEFDYEKALEDGLSSTLVMETKEAYDRANASLADSEPQFSIMAKKKKCGGSNRYVGNAVSGTIYLDSCTVNKMVAILNGGAAASGLIALIPGGAPAAGISVAFYGAGASILSYNNSAGKGIKIKTLRNPITKKYYFYWVKSQ
ncbi:hypothetical protein SAMN04489762_3011 [Terribacillus saccharophilus]|uniref:Uncharacterized protein n=1 Tax=Terribacillus saccharophilus TaxID=361277 RepID=A0AAX2EIJ9_9BACI|nr:hypothetical protein [Terribacillus saccharophilus]MEC0291875.1 hypothetical protein [Terribacillus saccharophilus]SEN89320.1 hypothetical protein SAMN04489762_3011 [Terribacillus saccharophilus]